MKTFQAGILGATGAVGQKFIRLLENHPWFRVAALGASERSAGKPYREAAHWIESTGLPGEVADMEVMTCDPRRFSGMDFVFSGLDSSVAGRIERSFAEAGIPVISNAKNHRMDDLVPLLVPEVNPDHAELVRSQRYRGDGKGWILTNPNCVSVPLAMSLRPLHDAFGVTAAVVTSMQSVSGAGYPGVSSMDILGNIVPHIAGEEEKVQTEALKLLGDRQEEEVRFADFPIQATAVRVPTVEGHLISVSVGLERKPGDLEELRAAYTSWKSPIAGLDLPSSPRVPVRLYTEERFPQPRLQAYRENGMQASVGRLRLGTVLDAGYVTLAHNTVRGAAGGAVLNAELLVRKGYL
ncbi:MAG: aspartate-semialdehyde dehydrogenase [Balneolaceae bacterium]|nr:aspartate-semialdehyde dehydrogenase [Balneolaceae bacterium]